MKLLEIYRELIIEAYTDNSSIMMYYVKFETSLDSEIVFKGTNKVNAMKVFDNFDKDLQYYDDDMYLVMEGVVSHYKFIKDDDIKKYPIYYNYKDDSIYKLISTEEPRTINTRKVKSTNKDSDEVFKAVQNYFYMRYGKRRYIGIVIGGVRIQLRISDHTENIRNIDRNGDFDYRISVVIADFDKTATRYGLRNKMERRENEYELKYNSKDKVGDIIMGINKLINSLKNPLL
jgi:hypothetical protein